MHQYKGLSYIYDYLVSGVDFEGWVDYVEALLKRFKLQAKSVVDLACGTGNTVIPFARRGYKATGIDLSGEMLDLARTKAASLNLAINFLEQDMRSFKLPEKVQLVTCFHDGLNYLLDIEDIKQTFQQVHRHLVDKGAFIFDLNAVHWLSDTDNSVTMVDEPDMTLIWETNYDSAQNTWQINLTGFIREDDIYHKFTECHREKAYHPEDIISYLKQTGFTLLGSFNAFSFEPIHSNSIRHFYVAQKNCD
ncbi:class I SAM-dependent DNA methyltransferase [Desulfallas thermosapovorans]|uniref:Methyltransferase family protein n=1 Tax=Desulfallas thermosapovorans DSM 6562 TaxID=1121431 RepID=A0A5S4ZXG2_9FIRM|nr:class I SAM-dependent methyltransferase [Desulfallas thermosapovorans]TYO97753.1 methyltransferase family protein [Desulfallas thermosapovorans DSM 6562]